tara:strand:+ start:4772 stop:5581 length:810 start_codon:yes stop_codon:yes gene_type:complete
MPELPEVETVTNSVKKHIINKSFKSIEILWLKTLHNFTTVDFKQKIEGKNVIDVFRRAKYIIIQFEKNLLAIHLRMTGKLYVVDSFDKKQKHISLYLQFDDKYLIYEDTRKFGRFYMYENMDILNDKLGIEPLSDSFSQKWLIDGLKSKKRQIKSLLFDQSFICGLGNIYIDESLWRAKIHPLALSHKISKAKIINLHNSIIKVLSDSIKLGGSTIRDYTYDFAYVGNYALNLKVFGKDGQKCPRCDYIITKIKVAQRGTHYCKKCQRK